MLDGAARRLIDPPIERIGARLAAAGIGADQVSVAGFAIGVAAAAAIVVELYWLGLALILASRACDGLDGAVARHSRITDRGGYLDIVLDFAFYGMIPMAFVLARPEENAVAGAALILSFYVNGSSFLAYAVMAEKRKLTTAIRGSKSLYFTAGLMEASETLLAFVLFCLLPDTFAPLALVVAALTFVTAGARLYAALRAFD